MNVRNRDFFVYDNLFVLRGMDSESVDLIYLDPPFNTEREQNSPVKDKSKQELLSFFEYLRDKRIDIGVDLGWQDEYERPTFKDRWDEEDDEIRSAIWHEGLKDRNHKLYHYLVFVKAACAPNFYHYLCFIAVRLVEMYRVLKPTGSLYLHCDQKMSHFLKLVLDFVFGESNFRNEIIWHYPNKIRSSRKKMWHKGTDSILFYTKQDKYTWNTPYIHLDKKKRYAKIKTVKGKKIVLKDEQGKVLYMETDKKISDNVLNIGMLTGGREYVGYPTQKPLALLARIIAASTHEGDIVLDPFAGCATTCVAAENLNRRWIGIDVLKISYVLNVYRLTNEIWKKKAKATSIQEVLPCYRENEPLRSEKDPDEDRKIADHIYIFVNPAWKGRYKVGITSDVKKRLDTFKTYSPYKDFQEKYRLEVGIEKAKIIEANTHKHFHDMYGETKEARGEWVRAKDIQAIIDFIAAQLKNF